MASPTSKAVDEPVQRCSGCNLFTRISNSINLNMETFFLWWGRLVCRRPYLTLLLCVLLCLGTCGGFFFYRMETDDEILWSPYGSKFIQDKKWIAENFPKDRRYEFLIAESDNILTAANIKYLLEIDRRVKNLTSSKEESYFDLCYRFPTENETATVDNCTTQGILGIFRDINSEDLTDDLVKEITTQALKSDVEGEGSLKETLSGILYNQDKDSVERVSAVLIIWILFNSEHQDAKEWELEFISATVDHPPPGLPHGLDLFPMAERSYDDEIDYVVNSNVVLLLSGFGLLFVYVAAVLGNFNIVEQRVLVSLAGLCVVGMSLGSGFGLGFYCGLSFNDMTGIIPFLLLGIGVDDMFVIVQCLNNLDTEAPAERVSRALQHAGLSITVTSFTDLAAFFIGASTSMPILRDFCLLAGAGVLFLYIFVCTFFVSCLLLDERRQSLQLLRRPDYSPAPWTRAQVASQVFTVLPKYLLHPVVSGLVILTTLGLAIAGGVGLYSIESDYDSIWYMRHESYQYKYYAELTTKFRNQGERVDVYIGDLNYTEYREELVRIPAYLRANPHVVNNSVIFWYEAFVNYNSTVPLYCEGRFSCLLGNFLLDPLNTVYLSDIKLDITPEDSHFFRALAIGNFTLKASRAKFQHPALDNSTIRMTAMNRVKEDMETIQFPTHHSFHTPIPYAFMYIQWTANKVISDELVRNLSIAFSVTAVVSLVLITEPLVALLVFLCVVLTLLDMAGFAYFFGLTIEIVTSICLLLSVGLALDYAAHIGVSYVVTEGLSGRERAILVLGEMGPAVFNGGLSTFLAFVLVAFSDSYVFVTFFKMFGMCVCFGLFHGLLLMPVLLSLLGRPHIAPSHKEVTPSL